ncbi:acyl-CoA thioesterase [Leifsonia sp. NPDC014704]|uniref:acyl-CoA thioesterase n=1 Tax=Leifsonia sp. NPDC014704 TaxID=3364123 RepID=UPI0036F48BB6
MIAVHMIFRTMLHAIISRFGARLGHWDVARTKFRVLPTDLDILKHMNNGVYLSIADIGRFDLLMRNGVWAIFKKRGWYPVVASETISFRKSLELWQPFVVESRILGFDEKAVYVEQRFTVGGEIYTQAFIRGRFLKRGGGIVTIDELLEAVGPSPTDVTVPEWLRAWGADAALPSTRVEAPSIWSE